jgi:uncharacterized protein YndB with AHSA1/START domain
MNQTRTLMVTRREEREVVITRAFAAPRHLVFDAWTTPALLRRWLGPRTWDLVVCEIDLREGGSWRYVMRGPEGVEMVMHGVYREIVAPERIVSTELYDEDWTGGETLVTTDFAEQEGGTEVTITVLYSSTEAREGALATDMESGMAESYGRLDDLLAEGVE